MERIKRRSLPRFFLLTDEQRLPDPRRLIAALPPGAGVIFRHYRDPRRAALAEEVALICRMRRLIFVVGGDVRLAWRTGADGVHHPRWMGPVPAAPSGWLRLASAHSLSDLICARRRRMDGVLLSPVFATASHPDRTPLGVVRFCALSRSAGLPVYALGGMDGTAMRRLNGMAAGFAALKDGGGLFNLSSRTEYN